MSQHELLEFLKENSNEWFTAKAISRKTNKNIPSVSRGLSQLSKYGYVEMAHADYIKGLPIRIYKFKKEVDIYEDIQAEGKV